MATDWLQKIREQHNRNRAKGYDIAHDDGHDNGELADAAACYAAKSRSNIDPRLWPWGELRRPETDVSDIERNAQLVHAGALIIAELERRERAGLV